MFNKKFHDLFSYESFEATEELVDYYTNCRLETKFSDEFPDQVFINFIEVDHGNAIHECLDIFNIKYKLVKE